MMLGSLGLVQLKFYRCLKSLQLWKTQILRYAFIAQVFVAHANGIIQEVLLTILCLITDTKPSNQSKALGLSTLHFVPRG